MKMNMYLYIKTMNTVVTALVQLLYPFVFNQH